MEFVIYALEVLTVWAGLYICSPYIHIQIHFKIIICEFEPHWVLI